jgi:hypothetical protein
MTLPEHFLFELFIALLALIPVVLSVFCTFAIGAFAGWVYYRQLKTDQDRLRTEQKKLDLDLFDRRFRVWETYLNVSDCVTWKDLGGIELIAEISLSDAIKFDRNISSANFLFDDEIFGCLSELSHILFELVSTKNPSAYKEWDSQNRKRIREMFRQKMDLREL